MTYSAGNIVVLKSGGPAMTVVSAKGDEVECIWMTDVGELARETIPAIALEEVELDEEGDEDEEDEEDDED